VKSLVPIVGRFEEPVQKSIGLHRFCRLGDDQLRDPGEVVKREWQYILGVRMRSSTEAKAGGARAGPYGGSASQERRPDDPSPLKVKEVWVEDTRRYVVCVNEDHRLLKIATTRSRGASLRAALCHGDPSRWWGNKGYRKYLRAGGSSSPWMRTRSGGSALRRQVGADDEHGSAGE